MSNVSTLPCGIQVNIQAHLEKAKEMFIGKLKKEVKTKGSQSKTKTKSLHWPIMLFVDMMNNNT